MPKRPNAKKLASQAWTKVKTLDAATTEGKYIVARVEKNLGFCQFLCEAQTPSGLKKVTALIRGKMKGGRNAPTRVEIGHFLLLDGDMSKTMEVVGVVNRQAELETLKSSGRVSKGLAGLGEDEDDLFDRSEGDEQEEDIWAKKDEEREAQAAHLLGRYRRAETGVRYREAACVRAAEGAAVDEELPEAEAAEVGFALWDAAETDEVKPEKGSGPARRDITSKRRLAAIAAAEAAAAAAEVAEARAAWEAMSAAYKKAEAEEAAAEAATAYFASRKIADNWEDEVDIDAI